MTYEQLALGKRCVHWPLKDRIRDAVRVLRGERCQSVRDLWDHAMECQEANLALKVQVRRLREKSCRAPRAA